VFSLFADTIFTYMSDFISIFVCYL
jgi:hypothetical protein